MDSWQLIQLRTMKVGGNGSATDFFTRHGGSTLLGESDVKKKYTSRVADLYKEELAKRVREDAAKYVIIIPCRLNTSSTSHRYPEGIVVEGAEIAKSPPTESAAGGDDDFFSSWDKPTSPKPAANSSKPAAPPVIGRAASASSAPRTVTSSSLRSTSTGSSAGRPAKLGASRLSSSASTTSAASTAAPKKSKLGGLGAKKAAPVDFAEAERKATEESERTKQLGYDREREEQEERARKEKEALELKSKAATVGVKTKTVEVAKVAPKPNGSSQDMERLGMGMKRLGFGGVPAAAAASSKARFVHFVTMYLFHIPDVLFMGDASTSVVADDAPTTARDRFGGQKAISSDMFFGRNDYDASALSESRARLSQFQGATSISSNQYFGREEEDDLVAGNADGGLLGDGSLAGLETAAKEALARVMANPDVQNLGESIRTNALKVCLIALHPIVSRPANKLRLTAL